MTSARDREHRRGSKKESRAMAAEPLGLPGAREDGGERPSLAASPEPRSARVSRALVRFGVVGVLLLTTLLYLPSLRGGYMADDWFHLVALSQLKEIFTDELNLFTLVNSGDQVVAFKHFGLMPWWTSEEMRIAFYRPIPSILYWAEHRLFGPSPAVAHLIGIGWYVFSVYLVSRVLARFFPERSAMHVLAVLIFALDDAHALNIAWIANRNETIGGSLVLLSLLAWLRYREGRGRYHAPLVALAYVGALLSKESALVLPVFVVAHALVFPAREGEPLPAQPAPPGAPPASSTMPSLWSRLRPHLGLILTLGAISVAFIGLYFGFGHGANSVYYINPLRNPELWAEHFFRSGFYHAVILATGVPLHVLSSTPVHDYPLAALALGAVTLGFWLLAYRWLRSDRPLRFFLLTMLAGQAIVTTSFPDPRNLFLPSIGFAYVVTRVVEEALRRAHAAVPGAPRSAPEARQIRGVRAVLGTMVALHLVLAPVLCQVCVYVVNSFEGRYQTLKESLQAEVDYARLPPDGMQVFFLNWHQREMTAVYGLYLREVLPTGVDDYTPWTENPRLSYVDKLYQGLGAERIHYYSLSFVHGDVEATVIGDRTIELQPKQGHFFPTLFEQLYTTDDAFQVGQTFDTGRFKATIVETGEDGTVKRVRFTFPEPLTSPRYRFLVYDGTRFVRAQLAAPAHASR
ncbi:hypothetical protein [Chondromyces apiculatus]|uniref:Glycosyltransferase RgtA/B/C/D-like domain-containing protein n=1 Tax=Chondromyces apiculatus DSM 436 TaxID=1192034 RepID=A0A017THM6_9BACT|nr:hypothetical protein [Chondromyces apiculatus]EYF08407.1 Hypothetical protein CAP_3936 [Chondromyces apiculatus DSM 436]